MAKKKLNAYEKLEKAGFDIYQAHPFNQQFVPVLLPRLPELLEIFPGIEWSPNTAGSTYSNMVDGFRFIVIIIDPEFWSVRTVVHELVHAKNITWQVAGALLDTENDEFEAYFMGAMAVNICYTFEIEMDKWRLAQKEKEV